MAGSMFNPKINTPSVQKVVEANASIDNWLDEEKRRLDFEDMAAAIEAQDQAKRAQLDNAAGLQLETAEAPSSVPIPPSPEGPCVTFPDVTLPNFTLPELTLPSFTLPTLPNCEMPDSPDYPQLPTVIKDVSLPRALIGSAETQTVVSTPAVPQTLSAETAPLAPKVAADFVLEFGQAQLIAANTTALQAQGLVQMLKDKAEALADATAFAVAEGIELALNAAEGAQDFGVSMANGLAGALNQAAAMVPAVQIPTGFQNPLSDRVPELSLSTDAVTQGARMIDGAAKTPLAYANNGAKLTKDIANTAVTQDLAAKATWAISKSASFVGQGLNRLGLCNQLDGMLWMMAIKPFHLNFKLGGVSRLRHSWRFDCHALLAGTAPIATLSGITGTVQAAKDAATGAMPGTLLHAAFGDNPGSLAQGALAKAIPVMIATQLGSPFASLIGQYVTNPGTQFDGLTSQLPNLFAAGDPNLSKLIGAMNAFVELTQYLMALTPQQVTSLEGNASQVGGATLMFISHTRSSMTAELQPLPKLTGNLMANRLTNRQRDVLSALAAEWDDVATSPLDLAVITDPAHKAIVSRILSARQGVLGTGERLDALLTNTVTARDSFGGPVGMELVYLVSMFCSMLRILVIINDDGASDRDLMDRGKTIMADAQEHASEVSYGSAYSAYIDTLAEGLAGGNLNTVVRAGLTPAVAAVKETTTNQQRQAATVSELMAQQRGGNLHAVREPANKIDVTAEAADTQKYITGTLQAHSDAIKKVVTVSVAGMGGAAKAVEDKGLVDGMNEREESVKKLIEEISNAITATSLDKATGTKLNQQYEGAINHAKFIFNQAGTSLVNDAPVVRNSARLLVNQGRMVLTEGDMIDTRAQWQLMVTGKTWGAASHGDAFVNANDVLTLTGKKTNVFGQEGTMVADKQHVKLNAANASQMTLTSTKATLAGPMVTLDGDVIHIKAGNTLILEAAGMAVIISAGGVALGVPAPPPAAPADVDTVDPKLVDVPAVATTADKTASKLPKRGARNPAPVAAPYKK